MLGMRDCRFEALEEGRVLGRDYDFGTGSLGAADVPLISTPRAKQQQARNLSSTSLLPTHHSLVISPIVVAPFSSCT